MGRLHASEARRQTCVSPEFRASHQKLHSPDAIIAKSNRGSLTAFGMTSMKLGVGRVTGYAEVGLVVGGVEVPLRVALARDVRQGRRRVLKFSRCLAVGGLCRDARGVRNSDGLKIGRRLRRGRRR